MKLATACSMLTMLCFFQGFDVSDKHKDEYKVSPVAERKNPADGVVVTGPTARAIRLEIDIELLRKEKFKNIEVVCCAVKIDSLGAPPFTIEETIVIATAESGEHSLMYLRTQPSNSLEREESFWRRGNEHYPYLFSWLKKIGNGEAVDEKMLVEFTNLTNFGNNEYSDSIDPIVVFLYRPDSPKLLAALKTGIGPKLRAARMDRFMQAEASPDER